MRKKTVLKSKYNRFGHLSKVTNPKGKKAAAQLSLRMKGWTPTYVKGKRVVKGSRPSENPERLARKLAKKGHKSVLIRD